MKKVFALFMVSALLAFAGSAFAADPVITATPNPVTVTAGQSATATLSATTPNNGTLGAFSVTGVTWATVSGTTLTFSPAATQAAGSYTATVSVTETYGDDAGHSSGSASATGTLNVSVTVNAPTSPDASPDVPPTSPDVSPDVPPTSPDVSPDVPPTSPDVSPDVPPTSPDVPPTSPDVSPDVPPTSPDVSPDVPPTSPDVSPDVPPTSPDVPGTTSPDVPADTPAADPNTGATGSGSSATTTVSTQKTVTNVVVIAVNALKAVRAADVKQSVVESLTASLATAQADLGMSAERVAYWQTQLTTISAAIQTAVNNLITAVGAFAGATVQDSSALEVEELTGSLETLIEQASAKLQELGEEQTAAAVLHKMKPNRTGVYRHSLPTFKRGMFGMPLRYYAGRKSAGIVRRGSVSGAADETEAVFLNSKGEQVTTVPDDSRDDVLPGFVTVAAYMEAGEEYEPIIATTTAAAQANQNIATETKASVSYIEEKEVVLTATFSTNVDEALLAGTNYNIIPASAVSTTGWEYTDLEKAALEADPSFDVFTVAAMPGISAPAEDTWYIAAVSFDRGSKTASDLYTGAALEFFPSNPVNGDANADVRFLKLNSARTGFETLTVNDVFGASSRDTQGFVAFKLAANTAATKPTVATTVKSSSTPDTPGTPDTPDTPDTPSTPKPGSSSGGCSAGFSALALAVLAGFIAKHRK